MTEVEVHHGGTRYWYAQDESYTGVELSIPPNILTMDVAIGLACRWQTW